MLAVYGHAVTWKHLILTAVALLLLMCGVALAAGWWGLRGVLRTPVVSTLRQAAD